MVKAKLADNPLYPFYFVTDGFSGKKRIKDGQDIINSLGDRWLVARLIDDAVTGRIVTLLGFNSCGPRDKVL